MLFIAPSIAISPPVAERLTFPPPLITESAFWVKLPFAAMMSTVVPAVILSLIAADVAESIFTDVSEVMLPFVVMLPVEFISMIPPEMAPFAVKFPPFEFRITF